MAHGEKSAGRMSGRLRRPSTWVFMGIQAVLVIGLLVAWRTGVAGGAFWAVGLTVQVLHLFVILGVNAWEQRNRKVRHARP